MNLPDPKVLTAAAELLRRRAQMTRQSAQYADDPSAYRREMDEAHQLILYANHVAAAARFFEEQRS